jgi:Trichohyalin-plectin-homology domain
MSRPRRSSHSECSCKRYAKITQVAVANQESTEFKRQEKIREEQEDQKVLDYIIEKTRRETEKEKKEQARKAEREIELARLRAAQEKVSDKQAQQDALRARRAYEAYEREWRRKEKESAEKQTQQEDDLRAERFKQQRAREEAIAVEAHKMKVEFFETLDCQKQEEISLKKVDSERAVKNRSYAQEVQVIPD